MAMSEISEVRDTKTRIHSFNTHYWCLLWARHCARLWGHKEKALCPCRVQPWKYFQGIIATQGLTTGMHAVYDGKDIHMAERGTETVTKRDHGCLS